MGALVPAPTRALYGSTKASTLNLYQALAIEHPSIAFSFVMPMTVEGSFRASAVDESGARNAEPNAKGLKISTVASKCIQAIDYGEKSLIMPKKMVIAPFLYALCPTLVERMARKKYDYNPIL